MTFAFASSIFGCLIGFFVGYQAGKCEGYWDCKDEYKPMLDRCRKYDEAQTSKSLPIDPELNPPLCGD